MMEDTIKGPHGGSNAPGQRVRLDHAATGEAGLDDRKAGTRPDHIPPPRPEPEPPAPEGPLAPVALAAVAAGAGGFKIVGDAGDFGGAAVASISDLDGDGLAEMLVGAPSSDAGGEDAGAAYVVWGKSDVARVDLAEVAAGVGGFRIVGEAGATFRFDAGDAAGSDLGAVGDLNGDGLPEALVLSAYNDAAAGRPDAGAVYVVWGKGDGTPVDLADVSAGVGGFKILAEASGDLAGGGIASMRDLNGDGLDEVLVGAPGNDAGRSDGGAAYVVWGKADNAPVDLVEVAAGVGGFKVISEADPLAIPSVGRSVASIGDLNGDGLPELLVGAPGDGTGGASAGAAYVVWGKSDGAPVDLASFAAGAGGFKIIGEASDDIAGHRVAALPDLNGDGRDEVLVSAVEKNVGGTSGGGAFQNNVGAAYVVWGKGDGAPVDLDAVAAGFGGYRILGEAEGDAAGADIATIADLNGDGRSEILLGASGNDAGGTDAGGAYAIWGKGDGAPVELAAVAAGIGGFKIVGEAGSETRFFGGAAGASVGTAADLTGDGLPEILVGAPFEDGGAVAGAGPQSPRGAVYVVFSSPDWIGAG